jgi:siroheme synthase-like protein
LDLSERRCVVVGGGLIAQRKVSGLLECGACVTLVSPSATVRLKRWVKMHRIRHVARRFRDSDVRGAWLVIAATDEETVNRAVASAAAGERIFTNVVDRKLLCSWIAPAVVRRGPLTIAISTGGASPSITKRLRKELMTLAIGAEYARMASLLGSLRSAVHDSLPGYRRRQRYFQKLIDGPVFELVRAGRTGEARQQALELLRRDSDLFQRVN